MYKIRHVLVSFKLGARKASRLGAGGAVADAPRAAQDGPVQGQGARAQEELGQSGLRSAQLSSAGQARRARGCCGGRQTRRTYVIQARRRALELCAPSLRCVAARARAAVDLRQHQGGVGLRWKRRWRQISALVFTDRRIIMMLPSGGCLGGAADVRCAVFAAAPTVIQCTRCGVHTASYSAVGWLRALTVAPHERVPLRIPGFQE